MALSPPDSAVERSPTGRPHGLGIFFGASGISLLGDGAFRAAGPLLAASITHDPVQIAAVTVASYLPGLIVGLPAGALVDRLPLRAVMITADLVRFGILALLTLGIIADRLTIAWLLFAIFMLGSAQSFFDSAAQGMIPAIVGRDSKALVNANANLWSIDALGRGIAGPAAGSAAFSISSFTPFLFDAFSFVASAFLISRLPAPIRRVVQVPERIYIAIREGIKFVARTEPLRQGALWLGTYNFGYNVAAATLVLYAQQTLGLSAFAYGLLIATSAFGAVLGTRLATVFKGASIYMTAVITLSIQAIGWLTIVLVPSVWSTFIAYPLISIGSLFGTIIITSARHLHTPDALLGRVVSVFQFLSLSSAGLGALLGGWIADIGGLEAPFLSATATLAMFILLALLIRWGRRGISDAQS